MNTIDPFEQSKLPSGAHHFLAQLAGSWKGKTRTWFEPEVLADESEWTGTFKILLDGRFVLHEYSGTLIGEPLHGYCTFGYDLGKQKFVASWIDQIHTGTGLMLSEGSYLDDRFEKGFSILGSYTEWGGETTWGWRTQLEYFAPNRMVITAFNITPQGEEARAVETVYERIE